MFGTYTVHRRRFAEAAGTLAVMGSALTPRGSTRRWRRLRVYVLERDNYVCRWCGKGGANTVDHIVPRARGGGDEPSNLAAAHKRCNEAKGARAPARPTPSRRW